MATPTQAFKSLFLPLKAADCAVFASVCTLLTLSPHPAPAAEAKGPQPSVRSTATFSPAEGGQVGEGEDSVGANHNDAEGLRKSALFALLSGRADGAVAVLKSRGVVFFSLAHPTRGPVELCRFSPVPTTREIHDSAPGTAVVAATSEATCASLLPLDLVYLSRVDSKQQARDHGAAPVYMRGLVGCRDGRVSVFSETSYIFAFAAHDCPVVSVQAIYTYDRDTADDASPPSSPTGTNPASGFASSSPVRSLAKATRHLGFVTAGSNGTVFVWMHHAGGIVKPKPLTGATSLRRTVALCVYQPPSSGWLLPSLAAEPERSAAAGEKVLPVYRNSSSDAGVAPVLATFPSLSGGVCDAAATEMVMPCPMAFYALPGARRRIRCQLLSPRALAKESEQSSHDTLATADVHDYVLPNVGMHSTTVLATDGDLCVLAYSNKLQAFPVGYLKPLDENGENELVSIAKRLREPVFTAKKAITHVALSGGLCVVACGRHGIVYVLRMPSFAVLGEFNTFECRSIASVSVYAAARLVTVVDAVGGSVELVQIPESAFDTTKAALVGQLSGEALARETYAALPPAARMLSTVVALRYQCELEATAADIAARARQANVAEEIMSRQDELRACQEALLLSAMTVSPACETYLRADTTVL